MKINVKLLPLVPNICNQKLREVWKCKEASIAYVEMETGSSSLWHFHKTFIEMYYILEGRGTMVVGKENFSVGKDEFVEIPKNTYHRLVNTGDTLRHLEIRIKPRP